MFINLKTGRPAWLLSQDESGVVFSADPPTADKRHHQGAGPGEFFAAHREATADELADAKPAKPPRLAKPKAITAPARGRAKGPKGPRSPRKAAPAGASRPAADKPPGGPAGPAGGEPHGE